MGAWQAPLPPLLAATPVLLALSQGFRGVEVGVERESCEAEGGRGRGSGGLSRCKMHCREAQMDQWAVMPSLCYCTHIHKDTNLIKVCELHTKE